MQNLTILNKVVFAANKIAQVLSHGHSLKDEVVAEIPSLRSLQLCWRAKAAVRNDNLVRQGLGWMTGIEGWHEVYRKEKRHGQEVDVLESLGHTTLSGRLEILVRDIDITLLIFAGPAQGETEGRLVLRVLYTPSYEQHKGRVKIFEAAKDLITGREDRLSLLWEIDEFAFGSDIVSELQYACTMPDVDQFYPSYPTLLEAKVTHDAYIQGQQANNEPSTKPQGEFFVYVGFAKDPSSEEAEWVD